MTRAESGWASSVQEGGSGGGCSPRPHGPARGRGWQTTGKMGQGAGPRARQRERTGEGLAGPGGRWPAGPGGVVLLRARTKKAEAAATAHAAEGATTAGRSRGAGDDRIRSLRTRSGRIRRQLATGRRRRNSGGGGSCGVQSERENMRESQRERGDGEAPWLGRHDEAE